MSIGRLGTQGIQKKKNFLYWALFLFLLVSHERIYFLSVLPLAQLLCVEGMKALAECREGEPRASLVHEKERRRGHGEVRLLALSRLHPPTPSPSPQLLHGTVLNGMP